MEYTAELARKIIELSKLARNENRFLLKDEVLTFLSIPYYHNIDGDLKLEIAKYFYTLEYFNVYYRQTYRNQGSLIEAIFIEKSVAINLFSEIIYEILDKRRNPMVIEDLLDLFTNSLEIYFGLNDTIVKGCNMSLLYPIIEAVPDSFIIYKKSSLEERSKHKVGLAVWDDKFNKEMQFVSNIISIVRNSGITEFQRVLLKVNLLPKDFGIPKPYKKEEILEILEKFPHIIRVENNEIRIHDINKHMNIISFEKTPIKKFKKHFDVPGLIIVSFTGQTFPIAEANDYINLRPAIYFHVVNNLNREYDDILYKKESQFNKIFRSILNNDDIRDWMEVNLSISFVLEDYDYLKQNFDKLMQEYSPVLNLEKNPGNLFRTIIEEKIREHESGKES
ncbi:MAG: hypothetical protein LCH52_01245 [Bacteroidetes bacterium]|nr:hypothetical protein [Bacteroidota bacterium]